MTRDELLKRLIELAEDQDCEIAHSNADEALLAYINDEEITTAFINVCKWYS